MRKKTFKNCLKLGLVFFCTLIFLSSCQNEEQILEEQIAEEQINDFEQTLLKKNKLKNNQAVIEAAKNWFDQNPNENNFTALEYLEEIDWNNAFVTLNNNSFAVEVPLYFKKDFNLIPVQKSKKEEKNYLKKEKTFSRLLFLSSNNSEKPFSSYLTNFYLDNSKTLENLSSSINYFYIHNSFKGKIAIIDANNNLIEFKDTSNKTNKQQYLAKLAPMEVTCVWWGWWYEDGHFEEISLVGCSSGSDYNPDTYGDYSNYGGGGSSGGNDSSNDNEPLPIEPDNIINNITDPCTKNIFTELENGIFTTDPIKPEIIIPNDNLTELNFSETILKLFSDSSNTDLTIQNGTIYGSNASTVSSTITLSDSYIQSATQLSISRTIIHETVHAYLNGVFHSYPDFKNLSLRDKLRQYATDNGYSDVNRFQHEFMGQYVNAMAYSLYEWDKDYGTGGDLGWDYYYSMGFAGLIYAKKDSDGNYILDSSENMIYEDTDSFKELIPDQADRDKIKKIISDEAEGNSNAKGEKC